MGIVTDFRLVKSDLEPKVFLNSLGKNMDLGVISMYYTEHEYCGKIRRWTGCNPLKSCGRYGRVLVRRLK